MPKSRSIPAHLRSWILVVMIALLFGLALLGRLYKIDTALGDWHSFRQVDTASVTREYVEHGIDLLHPRYHDVSNIQSGELNLEGWRLVEFPLLNAFTALIVRTWPQLDLVVTSRLVSVGASLVSLGCLLFLARRLWGFSVAVIAGSVFAFLPYSMYYSRVVLPEPFMVMWALLAAVAIERWGAALSSPGSGKLDKKVITRLLWLLLAGLSFAVALLVKPVAVFFVPFYIGIFWRYRPTQWWPWVMAAIVVALAAGPVWWWRQWIAQFPSGLPASDWLFNGNGIRLKPAWWRWLFADRIGRLMFGYWGATLLPLGLVAGLPQWKRIPAVKHWWREVDAWLQSEGALVFGVLGMLAYLIVFATGNVQHDYYQIPLVPILALLWARAAVWLFQIATGVLQKMVMVGILIGIAGLSFVFAWYEVSGWYNVNNPAYVSAGQAVQRLTPKDALVIAPGFGDTTFLFQTHRWGWPIGFEIEDKIADGAQYYVSTAYDDEARRLEAEYTVLEKTPEYIVIDLQAPAEDTEE